MARWKDVKKGKTQTNMKEKNLHVEIYYAGFWSRFLAMVTDIFMIGMPIAILITVSFGYETMKSQPGFLDALEGTQVEQSGDPLIFLITMSIWIVVILGFWYKTGQTPGKKQARVIIVDAKTFKKPNFLQLVVRLIFLMMPMFSFVSLFVMLFHPKKKTLHDMFSGTCVIYKKD